ncbi:MAG: 4-hydroxyphenylpyruvate dioxygenase, partial [Caballeronia sp.]|nr:4-hydroxyphenylpyruvate dioxygenase [Caballeronia sp.]
VVDEIDEPQRAATPVHVVRPPIVGGVDRADRLQLWRSLDPARLAQMREGGILSDRDNADGEFFQVYTEQFAERFFLEVVQRKGGYDGYGAVNAPVRLAAHAQRRHQEQ